MDTWDKKEDFIKASENLYKQKKIKRLNKELITAIISLECAKKNVDYVSTYPSKQLLVVPET